MVLLLTVGGYSEQSRDKSDQGRMHLLGAHGCYSTVIRSSVVTTEGLLLVARDDPVTRVRTTDDREGLP